MCFIMKSIEIPFFYYGLTLSWYLYNNSTKYGKNQTSDGLWIVQWIKDKIIQKHNSD